MDPVFNPDRRPEEGSEYDCVICQFLKPGETIGHRVSEQYLNKGKEGNSKKREGHKAFFKLIQFSYKITHCILHSEKRREGIISLPFFSHLDFE
jgi:hypothetical protein